MMPTFTTPTQQALTVRKNPTDTVLVRRMGFTFLETIVVVALLALMVTIAAVNLFGTYERARLGRDVARFARTLRLATEQAIFRGRDLAVAIEVTDGYYTIYEIDDQGHFDPDAEPLIARQSLDYCYIDDMEFADGSHQYSGEVVLYATPQGWSGSVIFNLIGLNEQRLFLTCRSATTQVIVANQPLEMPKPQQSVSIASPI